LPETRFLFQGAHCIRDPDEDSNSFEGSGENFETPIFIKEKRKSVN